MVAHEFLSCPDDLNLESPSKEMIGCFGKIIELVTTRTLVYTLDVSMFVLTMCISTK